MKRVLLIDPSTVVRSTVHSTLSREGWSVHYATAEDAIDEASKLVPDLIFLDFAEDATRVGSRIKAITNLSRIPLVLLIAEPDDDGALRRANADDSIRKPFSPDAIRTVAAHMTRPDRDSAPHRRTRKRRHSEPGRLEQTLFDAAQMLSGTYPGPEAQRQIGRAIAEAYDEECGVSFRGRIEHVPLGDLLQMLAQGHDGVLYVDREHDQSVRICIRGGVVDFVDSTGLGGEYLLGRYLHRVTLVDTKDIEHAAQKPRWIGRTLVEEGTITRDDLHDALREQSSELVYEALRWSRATFRFERFAVLPEAEDAHLRLTPTMLLMEGLRRVDEWRLIEQHVNDFDLVYILDGTRARVMELSATEERILGAIDDERTVRDVIEHTGLASFDVCKALYQFAQTRVIRPKR